VTDDPGPDHRACCDGCGTPYDPADPSAALAWARQCDTDGTVTRLCPMCVRAHARDIEARLPAQWWTP